ncbi:zinc-ribbon domain-containing protein [Collinsella aerofaciens]|uniref:zinc-ribbon domain-containing protein n=1 Tax=Collinsella aerofaciens TaxID=74426 RepID=UPI001898B521
MFCSQCGAPMGDNDKFCGVCGAPNAGAAGPAPPGTASAPAVCSATARGECAKGLCGSGV